MAAGIVRTYFQLASHIRCMKTMMTSIAFAQDTPIMKIHVGALANGHHVWVVINEQAVRAQRHRKTTPYLPSPPWSS